jgi:hypothetical protein
MIDNTIKMLKIFIFIIITLAIIYFKIIFFIISFIGLIFILKIIYNIILSIKYKNIKFISDFKLIFLINNNRYDKFNSDILEKTLIRNNTIQYKRKLKIKRFR